MSGPPVISGKPRPDRELLTASLLLFLTRGSGYGYGLGLQLREQALDVEMTVAYRVLRALERERQVSSRWIGSSVGPRRRLYSLTAKGRRTLDALVPAVIESRDRYCDFAEVCQRTLPRLRNGPPPDTAAARRPDQELLTGWVLLLLSGDASYGYDLRRRLAEHKVEADPSKVYRVLRRLDADGSVRSRWSDPVAGPRRRVYEVTTAGRDRLDAIVELVWRVCDTYEDFAQAYDDVNDDHRGPEIPRRAPR